MQLIDSKPENRRRLRLAAATLGLLGLTSEQAAMADDGAKNWTFDSGLLYYKEGGGPRSRQSNRWSMPPSTSATTAP